MTKSVEFKMNRIATVFLLSLSLGACVSLPGTDKKAVILTSRADEAKMGEEAYRQILAKEKRSTNPKWNAILQRVGKRIAQQAPVSDFKWEFVLIESPEMNAFCLPGGKVAFYTGILPVLQNEASMALVMGHEVAHAVLRHGGQRMTQQMAVELGLSAVDATLLNSSKYRNQILGAMGAGATVGMILPFSRGNESEADVFGLKYSAAAGYDPAEAPKFWTRFSQAVKGGKPPEFLSTHPADAKRIQELEKLQAEAQAIYAKSPKYGLGESLN